MYLSWPPASTPSSHNGFKLKDSGEVCNRVGAYGGIRVFGLRAGNKLNTLVALLPVRLISNMSTLNFDVARRNMIDCQIRPWDVLDEHILELAAHLPREDYVPKQYRNLAFTDMNIPLGHGEVMMAPKLEARLAQELEVNPTDKILEIGTGSGYMTALLAALGKHAISVEIRPEFTAEAATKLAHHGVRNITLENGDGARGWERQKPYDVILITGSTPLLPETFQQSLTVGGRMIAIVGTTPAMDVRRIRRLGVYSFEVDSLFETVTPKLHNALEPEQFVF